MMSHIHSDKNNTTSVDAKRLRIESYRTESCDSKLPNIFQGFRIYFMPTGIGSSRMKVFQKQAAVHGAAIEENFRDSTTHVIVEDSLSIEKVCRILKWSEVPSNIKIVKTLWLSQCLKTNELINCKDFELISQTGKDNRDVSKPEADQVTVSSIGNHDKSYKTCASEGNRSINQASFVCSVSSSTSSSINHNKHITEKLEVLAEMYKTTKDHWHAVGYEKAIIALKNHPKPVTTWEEARSIRGIGDRLADKIIEIVQSGNLRKIDETCSQRNVEAMTLFMKVWGVGATTAQNFVQQGLYTLEDLRQKGKLTKSQQIGLKYFDEFQERMPREEAAEIIRIVENQVKMMYPKFFVIACGSYRRHRETCGDVDILISPPLPGSSNDILPKIIKNLHSIKLLTDDLVSQEENGSHKKYMGVCKLPGENKKHRRIDIIMVPQEEYACALMHFTGSAYFNRSIRLLASKKNMSLSEHSLRGGVTRQGQEKITDGYILPTPNEKSIFEHLGLEYRPPEERDHYAIE